MPLETATYITDLNPANPAHSDGLNNDDAHARMIKGTLKATFPNFTSAPLNSTQAQLDGTVTTVANGVATLADAGAFFKTNTTDGLTNPAAGELDFKVAGTVLAKLVNSTSTLTVNGTLTATTALVGPGIVPIGGMIMWLTDTLPTDGVWCWANGGTLSRTGNGAALYAKWGTMYGAGDGVTTFNVINMQEVVPVGKSTMGGATSPGLLASIASGIKSVLGSLFGSDTYTLRQSDLPNVTPTFTGSASGQSFYNSSTSAVVNFGSSGPGGSWIQTLGAAATSAPSGAVSSINGNQTQTTISYKQPSRIVNFIIRIG